MVQNVVSRCLLVYNIVDYSFYLLEILQTSEDASVDRRVDEETGNVDAPSGSCGTLVVWFR